MSSVIFKCSVPMRACVCEGGVSTGIYKLPCIHVECALISLEIHVLIKRHVTRISIIISAIQINSLTETFY